MKLFENVSIGKVVKGVGLLAGILSVTSAIANYFLDNAKHEEVKETSREAAREEVRKILAETNEGA
jgi:hypothetical protein